MAPCPLPPSPPPAWNAGLSLGPRGGGPPACLPRPHPVPHLCGACDVWARLACRHPGRPAVQARHTPTAPPLIPGTSWALACKRFYFRFSLWPPLPKDHNLFKPALNKGSGDYRPAAGFMGVSLCPFSLSVFLPPHPLRQVLGSASRSSGSPQPWLL